LISTDPTSRRKKIRGGGSVSTKSSGRKTVVEIEYKIDGLENDNDGFIAKKYIADMGAVRVSKMKDIVRKYYEANDDARFDLMMSREANLYFYHPTNKFWGTTQTKRGLNMYGKILMELREQLRDEYVDFF
jgi:hypothetical protein